jgi:siderophore synthetase component
VILVLKDGAVERVFFKDIGEECAVLEAATPVPEPIARIRAEVPDNVRALSILTDVLDCFLRFLAGHLHLDGVLSEDEFWRVAAEALKDYQSAHPELKEAFERFPLFEDSFTLSCLNRLQLKNNQQMVNLENQEESLIYVGRLDNPLATWR